MPRVVHRPLNSLHVRPGRPGEGAVCNLNAAQGHYYRGVTTARFVLRLGWRRESGSAPIDVGVWILDLDGLARDGVVRRENGVYRLIVTCWEDGVFYLRPHTRRGEECPRLALAYLSPEP